eukprot:845617-Rhodomonas_salina.1
MAFLLASVGTIVLVARFVAARRQGNHRGVRSDSTLGSLTTSIMLASQRERPHFNDSLLSPVHASRP